MQEDHLDVPSIVDVYEKGISTSSMSKVLSLAGLRLGWIAAPKSVIDECMKHRDYTTISCGMIDELILKIVVDDGDPSSTEILLANWTELFLDKGFGHI